MATAKFSKKPITKNRLAFVYALMVCLGAQAQIKYKAEIEANTLFSNIEELPFWMYTNQRGRISEETNFAGWVSGTAFYKFSGNTSIEVGGGLLLEDGLEDAIFIDELYADFNYSWLQIIAGRKQRTELYHGLSATNENILWSLNARPMPGIQIKTNRTVYFSDAKRLGFEASWNEYLMGKQEYIRSTRVHHKSLHLVYKTRNNWRFKAGIQHVAQWGGTSPVYGDQPTGVGDYLRVVTGRKGGDNAIEFDQMNVMGNQIGSYEIYIDKQFSNYSLGLIYNSIFEDGSGSRLANFPDGRYGIHVAKLDSKDWFTHAIYEFYYTKNQSQTLPHLYDNYFNSGVYSSGWTYQERVIGLPFITTNTYTDYPRVGNSVSIGNNMVSVHHLGLSGFAFKKLPYKLLLSYRSNYGHYRNISYGRVDYYPLDDPRGSDILAKNILSTYLELRVIESFLNVDLLFGGDFSSIEENVGFGLNISKNL